MATHGERASHDLKYSFGSLYRRHTPTIHDSSHGFRGQIHGYHEKHLSRAFCIWIVLTVEPRYGCGSGYEATRDLHHSLELSLVATQAPFPC